MANMNLFYILKLNTSYITKSDLNVKLSYEEAMLNNYIVALGDNQLFKFIRRLNDQENLIDEIYETKKLIKVIQKQKNSKQNIGTLSQLQQRFKLLSFVPDIISVKADTTKKEYKYICKNMFSVTFDMFGIKFERTYKRLCAGAGQLRRNSAIFVNKDMYNELETIMMCGLTPRHIGKMNLAKFSAYFALYTSASRQVTTPRICVIPDYEYVLKDQLVDWVYDNEQGEKDIEERLINFDINAFDGAGMVSPEMAAQWADDLHCDNYVPSSFIVRSPWVKGCVSVFDFHKFAKEKAKTNTITDLYGNEHNINEIDVILTKSQFKLAKYYDSWEQYLYYFKKFKHIFSVTRINKKEDNKYTTLNYQYIQTNNFTKDSIKELASYSVNWAKKLMSKDYMTTMLFLKPSKSILSDDAQVDTNNDKIAKALTYCPNLINDNYVSTKILRQIQTKIDKMKIGKVLVEGAYEFLIPDLYAMAEHAFGMEIKGLLPSGTIWNRRWVEKGSKVVSTHRSPLVAPSENCLLNVYSNDDCMEWYQHIKSGNMYNIWDMTAISQSDADYDGDLSITTDNRYMVEAVGHNKKVITYEKTKAKSQVLNMNAFASMDVKSFNTKIGVITNIVSNMISMQSIYSPDTDEYKELDKRIKQMRYHQGTAIDSAKGDVFVPPPKLWYKKQKFIQFPENCTDEERKQIQEQNNQIAFNNKIAVDRKAYFFSYVYPKLKTEYDTHCKLYKQLCMSQFRCTISQLLKKENKSKEEVQFIHNYYKYMPVIKNNCTMNLLAYYIEDIEFDNKWHNNKHNQFDYTILLSEYWQPINKNLLGAVRKCIAECFKLYTYQINAIRCDATNSTDDMDEVEQNVYLNIEQLLKEKLNQLDSNGEDIANYVIYCYYNYFNNKSKSWMWDIAGDTIINNVKAKASVAFIPKECDDGEEYMGKHYILERVDLLNDDN